jgi:putative transcriptional regulator
MFVAMDETIDSLEDQGGYLQGQMLIAMPGMGDPRFERALIYLCFHSEQGALGLVVNKPHGKLAFAELLEQLEVEVPEGAPTIRIRQGGPVEPGRGFVLHSLDYVLDGTMKLAGGLGLTASVDILRDMAAGKGPDRALLVLGYAGWGAGQLDGEIQQNVWLNAPLDHDIVFDDRDGTKWTRAVAHMGIDLAALSGTAGHA